MPMVSYKNLLHNNKQIQCMITNYIVTTSTNIIIMQLAIKNDFHTHDQCIFRDAQENLVATDF